MRILDSYGIIYPLAFLVALAVMLWLHWDALFHKDGATFLLAAIFGVTAGAALTFAILMELGGRTMLLIPKAAKKLLNQGRAEGLAIQRERNREALRQFGFEEDGVMVLRFTEEVQEFLAADPESDGK